MNATKIRSLEFEMKEWNKKKTDYQRIETEGELNSTTISTALSNTMN